MCNQSEIQSLHNRYCTLTGISVPLSMQRIYQWESWSAMGWRVPDLEMVVRLLQDKMRAGKKTVSCLRFSYLIGNTEWFAEDLGEAQRIQRKPVRCANRDAVLRATGRVDKEPERVRSAADILAGMQAFKELQALKAAL